VGGGDDGVLVEVMLFVLGLVPRKDVVTVRVVVALEGLALNRLVWVGGDEAVVEVGGLGLIPRRRRVELVRVALEDL